jgi:outer membrane protein
MISMRRSILPLVFLALYTGGVSADVLGVRLGGGPWAWDVDGDIRYQSQDRADSLDLRDDLGFSDGTDNQFYLTVEHPVPLLPNFRLSHVETAVGGRGARSAEFSYGGRTFQANENLDSRLDLRQTDLTLYYRPWDTVLGLDIGLNFKRIEGTGRIEGENTGRVSADFDSVFPMVHGGIEIQMPFTGLSAGANGSIIGYDGHRLSDATAFVRYTPTLFLGIEGGLRHVSLKIDDLDDTDGKFELQGPYLNGFLRF